MSYTGIAFSGKAGSGKSSFARAVASQIADRFAFEADVFGYADPLKAACEAEWGMTKDMPGGREALARFGDGKRAEDPLYFIRLLDAKIQELWQFGVVPIVDDLRLADEFEHLGKLGFLLVRVIAPMSVRWDRVVARGDDPSVVTAQTRYECELDQHTFDQSILNLGLMHRKVLSFVAGLPVDFMQSLAA